ncbi:MAG TPA: MlaD family protein [Steroidobacteraceae bacterium]|nr:MlaD family protein [Steroidobacteraceae bacterium]
MEREANYAAVGAFVLLVTLAGALFVYWYSDTREQRNFERYEIYFTGSVSGLERGAAVRYLGVGVGRVQDIRVDPRDSSRVEVIVDIDPRPISQFTVAELNLQGVTGLLYIDLSEDRSGRRASAPVASLRYPVIRSAPSRFDVFLAGLPELVAAAGNLINRADRLLSDENIAAVTTAVGNLDKASASLPRTVKDLNSLIAELRAASAELAASASIAHGILQTVDPDVRAAAQRMRIIAESLADASSQLDKAIAENRQDIRAFTHQGLPEIERFVREGRAAAHDIRELSNSLRENPAQLLYQPPQRGVEIPR